MKGFHLFNKDLKTASKKAVHKNTTTAVNQVVRIFHNRVQHSNKVEGSYTVQDLWCCDEPEEVFEMLSCFCMEIKIKQQNSNPYTLKSLLQILINLQSYACSENQKCLNLMNGKDERFTQIHTVLDHLSCKLHKQGVGARKLQAHLGTDAEEEEPWCSGVMGCKTPQAL